MPHELLGCQTPTEWHRLSHFGAKVTLSMLPFRTVGTTAISENFEGRVRGATGGKNISPLFLPSCNHCIRVGYPGTGNTKVYGKRLSLRISQFGYHKVYLQRGRRDSPMAQSPNECMSLPLPEAKAGSRRGSECGNCIIFQIRRSESYYRADFGASGPPPRRQFSPESVCMIRGMSSRLIRHSFSLSRAGIPPLRHSSRHVGQARSPVCRCP